ncbi:hypothetical protein AALO_G00061610 [Alosa alosa]|uniref:GDNF family receptor alpha n=1 Tax=Alosa alosa TaxID=278164 RepID=A0AAV6H1S3_9TELE|nr:GDNF family receptor alpha-2a [Alosa alosa]KAG5280569.1 hypothetical protein AALO_G00061610 [Alosa alosa]
MYFYMYGLLLLFDKVVFSSASSSGLPVPVVQGLGVDGDTPVDCLKANDMCNTNPQCSSSYRVMRQCLVGRDRTSMLANKQECQSAMEVLHDSALYSCRCKRGMKKELQCLQSYWSIHMGQSEGEEFYEASPYEPVDSFRLASILSGVHSSTLRATTHCLDSTRPCNPCLDATKACNLNDTCKRQRSAYIATCNKSPAPAPADTCNRKRCHKALRQFFDRVQTEHSYGLLFCSCRDSACAERRRQTIVPSCSFEEKTKPNCLELRRNCRLDPLCRSRLADFHTNCQMSSESTNSCPNEDYQACLASYVGLIGTDMTPNYMDSTPINFTISPGCTCRGSGNHEEECERFLQDFRENTCLRNAIQVFGYGTDRPKPATVPPTTSTKPDQEVNVRVTKPTLNTSEMKPDEDPCAYPICNDLEYGEKCNPSCGSKDPWMEIIEPESGSLSLKAHAWMWITCLTPLLGLLTL